MPEVIAQEERNSFVERMFSMAQKLPTYFRRHNPEADVERLRAEVLAGHRWQRVQNNTDVVETYQALLLEMQNDAVRTLSGQNPRVEATDYAQAVLKVLEGMRRRIDLEIQKGTKAQEKLAVIAAERTKGDTDVRTRQ